MTADNADNMDIMSMAKFLTTTKVNVDQPQSQCTPVKPKLGWGGDTIVFFYLFFLFFIFYLLSFFLDNRVTLKIIALVWVKVHRKRDYGFHNLVSHLVHIQIF